MSKHTSNRIVLLVVFFVLISGCAKNEVSEVPSDALVVDARTPGEFKRWHYPGAVNIPVGEIELRIEEFGEKSGPIVVYCRSGHRSTNAKAKLIENGFTDVRNGGSLGEMKKHLESE